MGPAGCDLRDRRGGRNVRGSTGPLGQNLRRKRGNEQKDNAEHEKPMAFSQR